MNILSKNLQYLRRLNNLTLTQVSDIVEKGHNTISNWEKGINEPTLSDIYKICRFYDILLDDITNKDLEHVSLTYFPKGLKKDENVSLNVSPSVSLIPEKEILKRVISHETKEEKGIPLMDARATAGFGNSVFSIHEDDVKMWLDIPQLQERGAEFLIEVTGSSMLPKYNHGDIVACKIIKETSYIQWNRPHVIATKGQGLMVKRIKKGSTDQSLLMLSDNPNYDPFEVPQYDIEGIALIVGVIRME